jgi:5-hydroxyisourate hydrolase-like protein (transthyretin family)
MKPSFLPVLLILLFQTPTTGRIEGLVLKAGTNDPISGTRVLLIRAGTNLTSPEVITDRDGKFAFNDLAPGTYRLHFSSAGYVRQEFGKSLTIAAGDVVRGLTTRLTPAGNVAGRLWNDFGQPAVGVPVQIVRSIFNSEGQRILDVVGGTRSNDRGEYRIYWVTPGTYYLMAGSPPGRVPRALPNIGLPVSKNDPTESYTFTFYPGVTDIIHATPLDIRPGSDLAVDLALTRQQSFRLRGKVVDGVSGQVPASVAVSVLYSANIANSGMSFSFPASYNATTGVFESSSLGPGLYSVSVTSQSKVVAIVPVNVVRDIDDLIVTIRPPVSITGRIAMEGKTNSLEIERMRLQLRPAVNLGTPMLPAVKINADGTFRLDNVAGGEYRVAVNPEAGLPDTYSDFYIKDAHMDRKDVLQRSLLIGDSVPNGASLEIVLSTNSGYVEGVVLDARFQPAAGVQAVLVPERDRSRTELYKAAMTDESGRFTMRAVAPGEYKLLAWATLESYGYFDPVVLKQAEPMARSVHVAEGSRQSVDVTVIP